MTREGIGVTLVIWIELLAPQAGGRRQPISNGYRPICIIPTQDGPDAVVGLCELRLSDDLPPGGSAEGCLAFSADVSDKVRSLISVGSRFSLAEGTRPIGKADVRRVD